MLSWLRRFFYSDDPDTKLAAGMSEPEAMMMCELLENNGIMSFSKNTQWIGVAYGMSLPNAYDVWVRQSDFERSRAVLGTLLEGHEPDEGHGTR
jgi:hypothetical protein